MLFLCVSVLLLPHLTVSSLLFFSVVGVYFSIFWVGKGDFFFSPRLKFLPSSSSHSFLFLLPKLPSPSKKGCDKNNSES